MAVEYTKLEPLFHQGNLRDLRVFKNFWYQVYTFHHAAEPFAFAAVVCCEKPTSAKPEAKTIIMANGVLRGGIGGACAVPIVRPEALKTLRDGKPRFLRISPAVSDEVKSEAGAIKFLSFYSI